MVCVLSRMNIYFVFICMTTMFDAVLSDSRIKLISAHHKPEYDNKYEVENAVGANYVRSVGLCVVQCISNARCLSFFYNKLTGMCILHSDPFTYTVMSSSAAGWKFYLSQERYGRCLANFFYYRELDLCYKFGPPIKASKVNDDSVCPGSELIRVDSDERQDYIKLVTADIGNVYNMGIFIQGKKKVQLEDKWTYNDGSTMEYFKWFPGHPDRLSNVIALWRKKNYLWVSPKAGDQCTYMCEYQPLHYIQ